MKLKITTILLFVLQITTFGQVSSVNKSTGGLQVSIPLTTLSEGSLSVPIAIAYDGSGVAVDATASNVGLNWSLVAGGMISRELRGFADENSNSQEKMGTHQGYMHTGYPTSTTFGFLKDWEPDIFTLSLNGQSIQFILKKINNIVTPMLLNDNTDISIQVVVDTPVTIPPNPACTSNNQVHNTYFNENLINIASANGLSSFIVTTTDGIKYYFGKSINEREFVFNKNSLALKDYQLNNSENRQSASPISWKLSRIEYPKGVSGSQVYQSIDFNYTKKQEKIISNSFDKAESSITESCANIPHLVWNYTNISFIYRSELTSVVGANYEVKFNENIVNEPTNITSVIPDYQVGQFNNLLRYDIANIAFNTPLTGTCSNPQPCDNNSPPGCSETYDYTIINPFLNLESVKSTNNVVIVDKTTNTKKGYYLHHDYFKGMSYLNATEGYSYNDYEKLNLKGVYPIKFKNDGSTELQNGYSLQYIGNTVPSKLSLARDHWGYYNGYTSNDNKNTGYSIPNATCIDIVGTNMNPNFTFAQVGSLFSVKYPTGGTESYTYELHDCYNFEGQPGNTSVGGLRIKEIQSQESVNDTKTIVRYTYKKSATESSGYLSLCPLYVVNTNLINPAIYQSLYSRFTNRTHVTYLKVKEEYVGLKDGVESSNGYSEYEFYGDDPNSIGNFKCDWVYDGNGQLVLQCQLFAPDTQACLSSFPHSGIQNVYSITNIYPPNMMFRGLPKSVKVYSASNQLLKETIYKYRVEDFTDANNIECGLITHLKADISQVGLIPSGLVTFTSVASTILKLVPEANAQVAAQVFEYLNSVFSLVNAITGTIQDNTNYLTSIYKYKLPMFRARLENTINREYDMANNTNVIESTSKVFYESSFHKQVTRSQTFRSSNYGVIPSTNPELIQETEIKYSADYNVSASGTSEVNGLLALKNKKMLAPVETIIKRGNYVIGGTYNNFHDAIDKEGLLNSSYNLDLEDPVASASFTPSALSSNAIVKDSRYQLQQTVADYNTRALPTSVTSPNIAVSTSTTYGINDFLPIQSQTGLGTKFFTRNTEYAVPMFGVSKTISADNMSSTIAYDELGRVKDVKDQNLNYSKSYIYNEKLPPIPSNAVDFYFYNYNQSLFQINGSNVSISSQLTGFQGLGINATTSAFTPASTEFSLLGPNVSKNLVINSPTLPYSLFGSIGGFAPIYGTYILEFRAYSLPDRKGDLIGYKKMSFSIVQ